MECLSTDNMPVTDYINDKNGHWAPVFAILCDGNNFEFFVVDSAAQIVHSSGWVRGIPMKNDDRERTLLSIKRSKLIPLSCS